MRKFKNKNRKKRKYVKRNSPSSVTSLSRSVFIQSSPTLLVILAFLVTLAIITPFNLPELQRYQYTPYVPTESINKSIYESTQWINSFLAWFVSMVTKFYISSSVSIKSSVSVFSQTMITVMTSIAEDITTFIDLLINVTISLFNTILALAQNVTNFILQVMRAIGSFINQLIHYIVTVIFQMITAIASTLVLIMDKINHGIQSFIYMLGAPFRAAAAYYQEISPYINYVLANFKSSLDFLLHNMKEMLQLASSLQK